MEQNFDCVPCGFTSTNRYNYDIHVRTVKHKAKMEGLKCTTCGAVYDSRNKLTRHMKNVHIKKEKRMAEYIAANNLTTTNAETGVETKDEPEVIKPKLPIKILLKKPEQKQQITILRKA